MKPSKMVSIFVNALVWHIKHNMEGSTRKFEMATPPRGTSAPEAPKVEKAKRRPIEETETSISYLGVTLPKAEETGSAFVPHRDRYAEYVNDEFALELQKKIAASFANGDPILIEGGTSIGKTTTVRKMCAELGYEVHYVNLHGAIDPEDLMGKYSANPNRTKPEDPEYIFADGSVTKGLRRESGKKKVIILDEINSGVAPILKRLHEVLDQLEHNGAVVLSEDASEAIETNKDDTHIVALQNPPGQGYLGLEPLDPALMRRFVYQKETARLPKESRSHRLKALFSLAPKTKAGVSSDSFLRSREDVLLPEQLAEIPGIVLITEKYEEFHEAARELLKERSIAADQPQPFTFDDNEEPRRVRNFVARFYNGDINETFQQALRYYYKNKLESDIDRKKVEELIANVEVSVVIPSKRQEVAEEEEVLEVEVGTEEAERQKLEAKKRELLSMGLPAEHAAIITVEEAKLSIEEAIFVRALHPELPDTLQPEHLLALNEIFGKDKLEDVVLPKSEDLTDSYFDLMYPATQQEKDTAKGLVSYRPDFWSQKADASLVGSTGETWGDVFVRSMKEEAKKFTGVALFTESIQKPIYTDSKQQYGTKAGADATKDPLLPLIREVFGMDANRFSLSWDQINEKLIPAVTKAIQAKLRSTGKAPLPNFEVILTPALASNLSMTLKHPENSQTNTYEWTSTPLLKQDGTDSGRRLVVGHSGLGGASYVGYDHRDNGIGVVGFRLSVVFRP